MSSRRISRRWIDSTWLSVLRRSLSSALEWGRLESVPRIRLLKTPETPFDFLTPGESRQLLSSANEEPWRLMIRLALRAGLRLSELLALRWESINLNKRLIAVAKGRTRGFHGEMVEDGCKSYRYRYLPIASDLLSALALRSQPSGYVFSDLLGRPFTQSMAECALQRAQRAAGLRRFGWHVLRHTFATQLTSEGAPLHGVQSFLGHSSTKMTLIYTHFAPSAFAEWVEVLQKIERDAPGQQDGRYPRHTAIASPADMAVNSATQSEKPAT